MVLSSLLCGNVDFNFIDFFVLSFQQPKKKYSTRSQPVFICTVNSALFHNSFIYEKNGGKKQATEEIWKTFF